MELEASHRQSLDLAATHDAAERSSALRLESQVQSAEKELTALRSKVEVLRRLWSEKEQRLEAETAQLAAEEAVAVVVSRAAARRRSDSSSFARRMLS